MEIAIGSSTFFVDRIVYGVCMQICWTLLLSIGGIMSRSKRDIAIMSIVSLVAPPLVPLLALFGDFVGAGIFIVSAAIGCGIAIKARDSVEAAFVSVTLCPAALLSAGLVLYGAKTGNMQFIVVGLAMCVLVPLGMLADGSIRRRVNGELPVRATYRSHAYDDGGCGFGGGSCDFGSGSSRFGRSGGF